MKKLLALLVCSTLIGCGPGFQVENTPYSPQP